MEKKDQERIVTDLCDSLKESLLEKLPRVPEEWNGFELRQWMADYIEANYNYRKMEKRRMKEYKNTVIVKNLT